MNRLALPLVILTAAITAIVGLSWSPNPSLGDPSPPSHPERERAPREEAGTPALRGGEVARASAIPRQEETARSTPERQAPPPAVEPTLENTPDDRKHLLFARTHHIAKKLGWDVVGDEALFLARWESDKRILDRAWIEKIHQSGDAAQMRTFNTEVDKLRRGLIADLGLGNADAVLRSCALYNFAMPGGRWQRIDAQGTKVPFESEDEDVFATADWRR